MKINQLVNHFKRGTKNGITRVCQPAGGAFSAAVEYLTCCPAWWSDALNRDDIENSPAYFPVVGILLGVLIACVVWLLGWFTPPVVLGFVAVAALLKSTGAQGSVGLAAAFNNFFTSPLRKKVGQPLAVPPALSGGLFLAVTVLVGKIVMLGTLTPWQCARAILLVAVAGRCCMLLGMTLCPCVDKEGSLEGLFWEKASGNVLIMSLVAWGAVAVLLLWAVGLFAFVFSVAYTTVFSLFCKKIFGGYDKKSLFALSEACECVTILILAIGYRA